MRKGIGHAKRKKIAKKQNENIGELWGRKKEIEMKQETDSYR